MGEIFTLEEDPGAAIRGRQPLRLVHGRRPPDVMLQQPVQRRLERLIVARREVGPLHLLDRLDQRFGDV
jgi:hypothetical protein